MNNQCILCGSTEVKSVIHESRNYYYCSACHELSERIIDARYGRDIQPTSKQNITHQSVGALIQEGNRYLMIKRRAYPFGYSFPAGHIEFEEIPFDALKREVFEETALTVKKADVIYEGEIEGDVCRYGANTHMWYFYQCECETGNPVLNSECEGIGWFSRQEALQLPLVPVAQFFFTNVIKT